MNPSLRVWLTKRLESLLFMSAADRSIRVFQQQSLKPVKGLMDPSISDADESFNHDQTGEKREQMNTIIEERVLDIKRYEVHFRESY